MDVEVDEDESFRLGVSSLNGFVLMRDHKKSDSICPCAGYAFL